MKWLKIKKCLKIFSVIICSIFIFSNKSNALEFKYNGINFDSNEILDRIKEKYSNTDFENTYRYHIAFLRDNSLYFIFTDRIYAYDIENKSFLLYEENFNSYSNKYSSYLAYGSVGWGFWTRRLFYYYKYDFNNNTEEINTTNNANNELLFASRSEKLNNETWEQFLNRKVLYSNINFSLQEAISNENYYRPYDKEEIENPLKYRMQFNNDVSQDLKQITFDFPKNALNNSNTIKSKIEMGNWNLKEEEIPNFLNSYVYGYGIDGIKYDMSEYVDFTIDTTDYLTTKEITFTYSLIKEIPENISRLYVYYDFETFNNNYFFNVFDNFIDGTTSWNYIENFLVGYKKYTFPEGYDLAIIRSKSFKDLESFYISDKVYFINPDYDFNLKLYDFKNKIEKYNFNSLTQYLINDVYLKIPIKIDETNNIFPVLTKPMNNESGVFYLKDDLFVQFVNSENLDSIIDGIPEDDFNNNNDLNIDSDIGNLNPPQQDEQSLTVFFNEFWKMFKKFSDILSYISSCFTQFFISLPTTIQFFLCISFAFVIYKMLVFFIL